MLKSHSVAIGQLVSSTTVFSRSPNWEVFELYANDMKIITDFDTLVPGSSYVKDPRSHYTKVSE